MWALYFDAVLLGSLDERAAGLPITTVHAYARDFDLGRSFALVLAPMQTLQLLDVADGRARCLRAVRLQLEPGGQLADARDFDLGRRFALVLAPMQTLQLLDGAEGRARCLRAVRRHLEPGGLLAAAVAADVDLYEGEIHAPVPDLREVAGVVYSSRPVAIRDDGAGFILERMRERVAPDGTHETSEDRIRLDRLTADALEREAVAEGFAAEARRTIAETDDHVGSAVAMLRA